MSCPLALAAVFEAMAETVERETPAAGDVVNIGSGWLLRVARATACPGGVEVTLTTDAWYLAHCRPLQDGGDLRHDTPAAPRQVTVREHALVEEGLTRASVRIFDGRHSVAVEGVTVRAWTLRH